MGNCTSNDWNVQLGPKLILFLSLIFKKKNEFKIVHENILSCISVIKYRNLFLLPYID